MYINELVKIKRQSYDIGLVGKKSTGKTMTASYLCFLKACKGHLVFSNVNLMFPFIKINNLSDLQEVFKADIDKPKCLFLDDIDYFFSSKYTGKNIAQYVNNIIIFLGKINCSLIYTVKRSMGVLIDIRESSTNEFWFPEMIQKNVIDNDYNNILKKYLNFFELLIYRFDEDLEELSSFKINGLEYICKLYNTQEQVIPLELSK